MEDIKAAGHKFSQHEQQAMQHDIRFGDQSWRATVAVRYADLIEAQADKILTNVAVAREQQAKLKLHPMVARNTDMVAEMGQRIKRKALSIRSGSTILSTMGGKDDMDDKTAEEVAELAVRCA